MCTQLYEYIGSNQPYIYVYPHIINLASILICWQPFRRHGSMYNTMLFTSLLANRSFGCFVSRSQSESVGSMKPSSDIGVYPMIIKLTLSPYYRRPPLGKRKHTLHILSHFPSALCLYGGPMELCVLLRWLVFGENSRSIRVETSTVQ